MRLGIVYHMPCWRDASGTIREVEGSFARYVDSLAPYFNEIVLCVPVPRAAAGSGTAIKSSNVTLCALPMFDGPVHFYPRLPVNLFRIARFVRAIDVLHCRVPTPAAVFAYTIARLFDRRAFLLVVGDLAALRDSMPYRGLKKILWRMYTAAEESAIQWMADGSLTFANGRALAEKHARNGSDVVQTQTTTIQESDIETRNDTCAAPPYRMLTVSRIDPRKGLRILPDVIAELRRKSVSVRVDIVGAPVGQPGKAEQSEIEKRAAAGGVSAQLNFRGPVPLDALLPLYRHYDLFLLPTLPGEGIPRVLLESMAAGTPVVATRVAGIPSLVTHEENGLLVDSHEPIAFAGAIERLVSEPTLRRRIIAGGYETARAHTIETEAARMMEVLATRLGIPLRSTAALPAT